MPGLDRISFLPVELLCYILSFLSTEEAVRTSVLSSRWRDLYYSIPNFNLDDDFLSYLPPDRYETVGKNFLDFVDRLLAFRTAGTNIEKLGLNIDRDSSRVEKWIAAVVQRGIRQLNLFVNGIDFTGNLPDVMFSCKTLVKLKLQIETLVRVPYHVSMPNLKLLHLYRLEFYDADSVQRLVSSCILLEELFVNRCPLKYASQLRICHPSLKRLAVHFSTHYNYGIMIDAPRVVHFKYQDRIVAAYSLVNLNSLVAAEIRLYPRNLFWKEPVPVTQVTKLFKGIANVKTLRLSIPIEVLDMLMATFQPQLDPSSLWFKCKVMMIIHFFPREEREFEKYRYLLERATVLEELVICRANTVNISEEDKLSLRIKLSDLARALKKKCRIVVA